MNIFKPKKERSIAKKERNLDIVARHNAGESFRKIALIYGISANRVSQVYHSYTSRLDKRQKEEYTGDMKVSDASEWGTAYSPREPSQIISNLRQTIRSYRPWKSGTVRASYLPKNNMNLTYIGPVSGLKRYLAIESYKQSLYATWNERDESEHNCDKEWDLNCRTCQHDIELIDQI